jgi:hypothetical protein
MGVSELGPEAGTIFRKTALAYRARTIALTFVPRRWAMQRIAIGRTRVLGLVYLIMGALGCALAIALLVVSGGTGAVIAALQLLLWAAMIAVGLRRLLVARRRLAALESGTTRRPS